VGGGGGVGAMKVLRHTSTHVSAAAKGYAKVASHI